MPSVCPIKLIRYLGPLCIMPTYISGSSLAYVCTPTNSYRAHVRLRNTCTVRISTLIMSVSSSYTSICARVVMFTRIQKADFPLGLYFNNLCMRLASARMRRLAWAFPTRRYNKDPGGNVRIHCGICFASMNVCMSVL